MDYSKVRLYEVASILSPSMYETVFYSQYQVRSDKDAMVLDDETFEKCYVSNNVYKNFLFANAIRLGKSVDYIGVNQMHSSIIEDIKFLDDKIIMKLNDLSSNGLASTLINLKSLNKKLEPFYITLIFNGVNYYSNNYIDETEKLIPIEDSIIKSRYWQDQLIFVNEKHIDIVISAKCDYTNKLRYTIIDCNNIEVIETAKYVWKNIFKNEFSMLYEYFINIRKSNNLLIEGNIYENIILDYEKFMGDFIDLYDF